MKLRTIVIAGAAAAFLFGTEQGRALVDKVRAQAKKTWDDPDLQAKVHEYTDKAADFAKDAGRQVTDFAKDASAKVSDTVSDVAHKAADYVQDAADEVR